jgi:hypothetical protein
MDKTRQTTMLEGIFLAVVGAVFSYVIEKLEPAEQIKKWLKREPASLAFQKALSRAYTAFARQYPEYTASLFDQTFLAGKGAPELAKLLTSTLHPDPALFAQAWGTSIGLDINSQFCKDATKPAADFLKWLEAELKSETVFQPIFDSHALENLHNLELQIEKLTTELNRGVDAALKTAMEYEKIVLDIEGDVSGSIVVGDNNRVSVSKVYKHYHSGEFATLNDNYIPPDGVFQRVRIDEFIGRDWLTAKIDAFLNQANQKSGIFLLIGEAGVGKTSFMAHLVKERRYLHLFAEQVPGDANLQRAFQSLGSQLVTRYQIDTYKDRNTLTQLAAFPDFLDKLLRLAADNLTYDEKVVIVCDALDEAGTFPDGNVFGLPNVLPDNVYFILSQRPVNTKLPIIPPHIEKLDAQGGENLQDMEDYLRAIVKRPEISGQILAKNYSDDFFVQTLKEKSLGVWMYLHYIIKEIESGSRTPLDIENLPIGLIGYYADFWDDWRNGRKGRGEGPKKWDELYAPLLTTLSAAQEPLTVENLMVWSNVKATTREIERLLQEAWRAFLTIRDISGTTFYTPYHASFRDFLTGKVDLTKLSPAQSNLVRDLAKQTREAHKRIVNVFRDECNSDWPVIVDQDYPRLHLATHLSEAGDYETLINLLTEGNENITWAETRYMKEETYAGFLIDLEHVWKYAEQESDLVLSIRCMLIENSIHSLATNIPPGLIVELAISGMWSFPRCLTIINQMSKPFQQTEALNKIAQYIPPYLHKEALSISEKITDNQARADAIIALLPYIDDQPKLQSLEKAAQSVNKISHQSTRFSKFIDLISHLNEDLKPSAIQSVLDALPKLDAETRVHAIIKMIPHLNEDVKLRILQIALDSVEERIENGGRLDALIDLIPHLIDAFNPQVLNVIQKLKSEREQSEALTALIPHLNDENKISVLDTVQEMREAEYRARVLTNLILYLRDEIKLEVIAQSLVAAQAINDEYFRAIALSSLIPHLKDDVKSKVSQDILYIAQGVADKYPQDHFRDDYIDNILFNLLPHLSDALKPKVFSIVQKIEHEASRVAALVRLAPYLSDDLQFLVLAAIEEIKNEESRVRALTDLIPHLSNDITPQVIQNILSTIRDSEKQYFHTFTLINLLPHISENQREEILREAFVVAQEIKDEEIREMALYELMPNVSTALKTQVLQEILEIKQKVSDEEDRAKALSVLMVFLDNDTKLEVQQEVLATIQKIKDEYIRVRALTNFMPYLTYHFESHVMNLAKGIKFDDERAESLVRLMPYLSSEVKSKAQYEALIATQKIKHEASQIRILLDLVPHLSVDLKSQALLSALNIIEGFEEDLQTGLDRREGMFTVLLPFLNDELIYRAFLIAQNIHNERERAQALSELIPYVNDNLKSQVLTIAQEFNSEYYRSATLITLLPYLEGDLKSLTLQAALEAARKREEEFARCYMLINLIPHLGNDLKPQIVHEILTTTESIKSEDGQINTLKSLIPNIHTIHIPHVLDITNHIKNQSARAEILIALIPVSYDVTPLTLATIQEIKSESTRTETLVTLMPYLRDDHDIKQGVLNTALEIDHVYYRATALIALLSYVNNDLKRLTLKKALENAQLIPWGVNRADVLSTLLPHVGDDQKTQILQGILDAIKEIEDEESRAAKLIQHSSLFEDSVKISIFGDTLLIANFELIETIISEWGKIDFVGMEKSIYSFLRKIAQIERSIGLSLLSKLLPALVHFSERGVCTEILRSIRDTARWWP